MKKVIIPDNRVSEIDWSKPQWVISTSGTIVLTTGKYSDGSFTGACLPCHTYPDGKFSENWDKGSFNVLKGTIHFEISNED